VQAWIKPTVSAVRQLASSAVRTLGMWRVELGFNAQQVELFSQRRKRSTQKITHYPEIVRVRGDPMAEKYPLWRNMMSFLLGTRLKEPRGSCTFSDGKTHLGKDRISLCPLDRSGWMMEPSQPQNETSILDLPPQCSGRRISLRGKVQLWKVESLSTKIKA
jgi:hypothetical protein